jgi:hypothetical protein
MTDKELKTLVDEYQGKYWRNLDDHLDYYTELDEETAIRKAVTAELRNGKRDAHQRRLKKVVMLDVADRIQESVDEMRSQSTFDDLLKFIGSKRVPGFGQLAIYDTALRLGRRLGNKMPETVYLHAGVRHGAAALVNLEPNQKALSPDKLPKPLRQLPPYHIEHFLCIYKDRLRGMPERNRKKTDC